MRRSLTALAAFLSTAALSWAGPQEAEVGDAGRPDIAWIAELELVQYRPENANPIELHRLARSLVGREFYVHERGGYQGESVPNLTLLGDTLVLYDTAEYIATMTKSLAALDQPAAAAANTGGLATFEYQPRYVSLHAVGEVLRPFRRKLFETPDREQNMAFAEDRSLLVVRDTPTAIEEIEELLKRIDVPESQVLITCHLLSGTPSGGSSPNLPAELVANLEKMLPGYGFQSSSFAMLRASVVLGREYELLLEAQHSEYLLSFSPVAYDDETTALTVERCRLREVSGGSEGGAKRTIFSTDTIFHGREYTVLGATGAEPIFVVVRVTPMES